MWSFAILFTFFRKSLATVAERVIEEEFIASELVERDEAKRGLRAAMLEKVLR